MAGTQPEWVTDGWSGLVGGVDMGLPPSLIGVDQMAFAKDATCRGGWLTHRSGMKLLGTIDVPGMFQGAGSYVGLDGIPQIFVSVAGNLHRFLPDTGEVTLNIATGNSPNLRKAWFCQGEEFLFIQDGVSRPWIYDGVSARRAGDDEVPVGEAMAYGIGRLWVARGRHYVGGDLVDSDPLLGHSSIIKFTENTFINEGGAFAVPWQSGKITGLTFASKPHTATGTAGLMVTTENGWFEFNAPVDRTTWQNLEQPLQQFALLHNGATSHESLVLVNGDIWYRGTDGIRSFVWAERDFLTWGNTPESAELDPLVTLDERDHLQWASAVLFDNRLLMTTKPELRRDGTEHRGLLAIDFDPSSGLRRQSNPAWEGVWLLGWRILEVINLEHRNDRRAFAIVRGASGGLEVWEFSRGGKDDNGKTLEWMIESRSMTFRMEGRIKKLETFWFWMDKIRGNIEMSTWYRSDTGCDWVPWGKWVDDGPAGLCAPVAPECDPCRPPVFPCERVRDRVTMPQAPERCVDGEVAREGFEFQVRFIFRGRARLKKVVLMAGALTESMFQRMACAKTKELPCEADPCDPRERLVLGLDEDTALEFAVGLIEPELE